MKYFWLLVFNISPKMGRSGLALQFARTEFVEQSRQVGKWLCYFEQRVLFLVKLNPESSNKVLVLRRG